MRLVVRIEDENLEVFEVRDFDESHDENVLRRKELVTALAAARNFVEDAVRNEPVQDLSESCQRGQRFGAVAACVDDLHGRALRLARLPR